MELKQEEHESADNLCFRYKVVLVGDSGVGKSNLHTRFLRNNFYASHIPTLGVDYGVASVDLGDHTVVLNVWDTAGQERFHALTSRLYMKGARAVVFVYDITRKESFDSIRKWLSLVEQSDAGDSDMEYLLIGNKADLTELRSVTTATARALADEKSMLFIETSALTGVNTSAAFRLLASEIHRQEMLRLTRSYEIIPSNGKEKNNNRHHDEPIHDSSISLKYRPPSETKCC